MASSSPCCDYHTDGRIKLCFGVLVKDNGEEIVVFDASRRPVTFELRGPNKGQSICFSTHGHTSADIFLTPCFDKDGYHGVPDEECFCGEEGPHLHAHYYDERRCVKKNDRNREADLAFLASLTLFPKEESDSNEESVNLLVSERLPNACNASEYADILTQKRKGHRVASIRHDDHMDYLVYHCETGNLHLEHECRKCDAPDIHGKLGLVAKRKLDNSVDMHFFEIEKKPFRLLDIFGDIFDVEASERVQVVKGCCPKKANAAAKMQDCCFDGSCSVDVPCEYRKALSCEEGCCNDNLDANLAQTGDSNADDCSPDCCNHKMEQKPCCASNACAVAPGDSSHEQQPLAKGDVRTKILCDKICCASEIPPINTLLCAQDGIVKTMVNVPLKTVLVDHDPDVISAKTIAEVLKDFGPTLQVDGAAASTENTAVSRSQFYVDRMCCASEVPMIHKIVGTLAGVKEISVNVPHKMVYVHHDTLLISAQDICDSINHEKFGATLKHDGAEDVKAPLTAFVRSTIGCEDRGMLSTDRFKAHMAFYDATQIESFSVDLLNRRVHIIHNPLVLPVSMICQNLEDKVALKFSVVMDGSANLNWEFEEIEEEEIVEQESVPMPRFTVLLSGLFWIISMFSFLGGNWEHLKYVAILSVLFGLPHVGVRAFRSLVLYRFDVNVLMFSAAVGAVALQEFTEAAAVTFLFSISEWLEARATTRARNALSEIVNLRPDKANLIHPKTNQLITVPAKSVPVGAIVSVKNGDKIPCDGVVVGGQSTVNESSLTGESRPVKKGPKDDVFGGTINSGMTELLVRTTSTADNSAVARLIRLVEEAQTNRSETEKMVDQFAKVYTPIVLATALALCSIPWAFGSDIGRRWTNTGLVLMVVACPCALIISTPVVYVAGLAATAQKGILIKGGAFLEALGRVKKIAFDKTGTLTQGNFALVHLKCFGSTHTRREILEYLALAEQRASHPMAQAITVGVQNEGVSIPENKFLKNHTALAGEGIVAEVDGTVIHVGNERLFRRLGLIDEMPEEIKNDVRKWASVGGTVGFMSLGNCGIVCAYSVADAVRPEAERVVRKLKNMGIEPTMLTGDNSDAAFAIGKQLGLSLEDIRSQLFPEDKLTLVREMIEAGMISSSAVFSNPFKQKEVVMMVGDGVNDAAALAIAHVGVAMGSGAALAMETSDVTLLDSHLEKLVVCIQMGKRVVRKIQENILFSLIVKAIVVGFTLSGRAHLWAAILSDVGSMLLVTLNGIVLLPGGKREIELKQSHSVEDYSPPDTAKALV